MNNQEILAEIMMIPATELALLQRIAGVLGVALDPDGDAMKNALVAHLQTLTPADPADPAAEAELLAWMAAPAPVPAPPAPTAPATSTIFNNVPVQLAVRHADPVTDEPYIDRWSTAYGLPTTGDFFAKRARLEAELHAHPTDPAPAAVDTIMADWVAAHPPPDDIPRRNNDMNRWIIGGLVALAALLIYFVFIAPEQGWWPNDDDNGTTVPTSPDATPTPVPTSVAGGAAELDKLRDDLANDVEDALDDVIAEFRDDLEELLDDIKSAKTLRELNELKSDFSRLEKRISRSSATPPTGGPEVAHFARLETLDPSFRSGGWQNWLSAAGVQCETVRDARQPEEETSPSGKISVAGLQVEAKSCHVPWPNVVTTDVPSRVVKKDRNAVQYKPDPNNGSVLYTNVTVTGPVTIWADAQNWGQFTSKLGFVGATSPDNGSRLPANGCFSLAELDSRYGIDRNAQGSRDGLLYDGETLAGATLRLTADQIAELDKLGWTIQGTNPTVKSAWSPAACRPLS